MDAPGDVGEGEVVAGDEGARGHGAVRTMP
jgi:hypothetical protein